MKRFLSTASVVALLPAFGFAESWTGQVLESRCGAKHAAAAAADLACMRSCLKAGAIPVLLVGAKQVMIYSADVAKIEPHLGHKVTVTGKLEKSRGGDIIHIESIEMAQ
ncbi:MAG: hypothetical protein ABI823_20220 [Bryobacteraceae bacterium]